MANSRRVATNQNWMPWVWLTPAMMTVMGWAFLRVKIRAKINSFQEKAKHITDNYGEREKIPYADLNNLVKSEHITENSYKQIDELFIQIKHRLEQTTKGDQLITDDLNNLLLQLEYWVESLVIESMKLKSLERWLTGTKELAKNLRAKLDKE